MKIDNYSVLMSTYKTDNPKYLIESIDSILNQTVKTNDFVLVKDGKLTEELDKVIDAYINKYPNLFNIIALPKNVGLGKALAIGITYCKNEYVARMDSDDYSFEDRISKELNFLSKNPNVDIVGTQAIEFIDDVNNPVQYNSFPTTHIEIVKYAHSRNPYSHPSVIFKKSKVISAGNYQDAYLCEDYDLWIRLIQSNCICANLDEYLFAVRVSADFYKRRSGLKYVKSINNLMKRNFSNGFFNFKDYIKNIIIRSVVYLMPNGLRKFIYSKFLRKGANSNGKNTAYSS